MSDEPEDEDRPGGPRPIDHSVVPTRTGLVIPDVRGAVATHTVEMRKAEFEGLAAAISLDVAFSEIVKVREVRPATLLGAGQVEALRDRATAAGVELLLIDTALAPVQQRNLEKETG